MQIFFWSMAGDHGRGHTHAKSGAAVELAILFVVFGAKRIRGANPTGSQYAFWNSQLAKLPGHAIRAPLA
jgi:hypothetical protein